jgi:sarcosine oxidase, subunit beta
MSMSTQLESLADPKLEPCGFVFVADSDASYLRLAANAALQNELGIPSRLVSPVEAAELVPGLVPDRVRGAVFDIFRAPTG